MNNHHDNGRTADQYIENTKRRSTVYGEVGDLSPEEARLVRQMYREHRNTREAAVEVLKMRGQWPADPDPRQTYPRFQGARLLPRTDGFGRVSGRRR